MKLPPAGEPIRSPEESVTPLYVPVPVVVNFADETSPAPTVSSVGVRVIFSFPSTTQRHCVVATMLRPAPARLPAMLWTTAPPALSKATVGSAAPPAPTRSRRAGLFVLLVMRMSVAPPDDEVRVSRSLAASYLKFALAPHVFAAVA